MEPFSIACTTCRARLRVRDESVIGQILTCPKCGSMVLVEPTAAASDASHDSSAMHQSDSNVETSATSSVFEDAAALFDEPHEPTAPTSPDQTETVEDLSVQGESNQATRENLIRPKRDHNQRRAVEEPDESVEDVAASSFPPPLPHPDEALLPNADWTSASTVKWRNRILTGIAAVVGVVLAMILFIVFGGGDDVPQVALRPTPPSVDPADTASSESPTEPLDEPVAEATPDKPIADGPPAEVVDAPVEEIVAMPVPEVAPPVAAPIDNSPPASEASTDEPPGLTPKEPTDETSTTADVPSPLSQTLRDFGALLDETKEPARPMPEPEAELPPAPEPDESTDEPVARRTGARVVELDDRLNDPIAQLQFNGVPLENFLKFVSDYSTIPITLDADVLRWVRISPATPVVVTAKESTVADVLTQGLKPLGLEHRVEGDQLFITRQPKEESGIRSVTFKVDDLAASDPDRLKQLGDRMMNFVAPETWSSRGGVGTITFSGNEMIIEQYETVQFEILAFCERLRIARGLKTRSPYDATMFQLATRGEQASKKLATPITLTYIRPAPLQRIVDRLAQASKLHILIDWRELAAAGWSPDAEVRFSVADQPLSIALKTLLEPMDLAYRVVDESTLQITTPDVLDSRLELEFYRVAKPDDDGTAIVEAVRDALGPANFRDFGGGGQLAFDVPSNCLLVSLSQTRQLELQAWLAARPDAITGVLSKEPTTPTSAVGSRIVPASGQASND